MRFGRKQKKNKTNGALNLLLALFVFGATYLGLTPDAITMEDPSLQENEITCNVWYSEPEAETVPETVLEPAPEAEPTPEPESEPTPAPEAEPTPAPEAEPTPAPEAEPTPAPEAEPTPTPESEPTPAPEAEPTPAPEAEPTPAPEAEPTPTPEAEPTPAPEAEPTPAPEAEPTPAPESEPTQDPEVVPTTEPVTAEPTSIVGEAPTMLATGDTGFGLFDFGDSITDFKILVKKKDAQGKDIWVESTQLHDGDQIKVELAYAVTVPPGSDYNRIYYQLPGNVITLLETETGDVKHNGVKVGTYTIDTNGYILITFDDTFDTEQDYTGELSFGGTIEASAGNEDKVITFDKEKLDFSVQGDEPGSEDVPNLATHKNSTGKQGNNYQYEITVSSKDGTGSDKITITDAFIQDKTGDLDAAYIKSSFQVTRTDKDGNTTTVNDNQYDLNVLNGATPSEFIIADLPALGAGESYTVTYEATPDANGEIGANGSTSITNRVVSESGTLTDTDTVTEVIREPIVEKNGTYNKDTKQVTWTVTIKPGKDIDGYKLSDTMTATDGTPLTITGTTLSYTKGTNKTTKAITLPYTFVNADNGAEEYTITYTTDVSNLTQGQTVDVSNNVGLKGPDEEFTDTAVVPGIKNSNYDFDKTFQSVDEATNTYTWQSTIDIPTDTSTITSALVYKDFINTTLSTGNASTSIPNAHYTTVDALRAMSITIDGAPITPDSIKYTALGGGGQVVLTNALDGTIQVQAFVVRFVKNDIKEYGGKTIVFDYQTYINPTLTDADYRYTIQNSAVLDNNEVEVETTYPSDSSIGIEKEAKTVEGTYTAEDQTYEYDIVYDETLGYAYLSYRAKFDTAHYTRAQLENSTLTDILPEGTSLITDGAEPVVFRFVTNDNQAQKTFKYPAGGTQYNATRYLDYTVTTDSETGRETVTFDLSNKYFTDYNTLKTIAADTGFNDARPMCFWIEYKIKLPDMSTSEIKQKTFINQLNFGLETAFNTVTVRDDEQFVSKIGVKEMTPNGEGVLVPTNNVDYTITVNEFAKDLAPDEEKVVLTDTLKFIGAHGATADLIHDNFAVYEYNADATDHKGRKLDSLIGEYSYTTETITDENSVSYIFHLTIPDSQALIVEYRYRINTEHDITAGNFIVENSVQITGGEEYTDDTKITIDNELSDASVEQQALTIRKYDIANQANTLPGATFEFKKWKDNGTGTYDWVDTLFGTDSTLTTQENGLIEFELTDADGNDIYEVDRLYRFTETIAPNGYRLDVAPRYFVFVGDPKTQDLLAYVHEHLVKPDDVYYKDIIFIVNSTTEIPIANEKSTLAIEKKWVDSDGDPLPGDLIPDEIKLDLYRSETKAVDACNVTVTSTAYSDSSTGGASAELDVQRTLSVSKGSDLLIRVFNSRGQDQYFSVNGGTPVAGYIDPQNQNHICYKVENITGATNIIITSHSAPAQTFDFSFFDFTQARYESNPNAKEEFVKTITLTKAGNWAKEYALLYYPDRYTGDALPYAPSVNSKNPYVYYVKESSIPAGFAVTYSDSNMTGVTDGTITVTNTKDQYALPSTGGANTIPYKLGVILFVITAIIYIILTKREGQQNEQHT